MFYRLSRKIFKFLIVNTSMIKELLIKSSKKQEIIDITQKIEEITNQVKINEGICLVYVPHTTCALMINENWDPNIKEDILESLDKIIPKGKWKHDSVDGNGSAHIKSSVIGPSQIIPIKDNKLILGRWQNIMIADFDGPKERRVIVQCIKNNNI